MSIHKQRECVVVIACLKRWYLDDNRNAVTGIVHNSIKPGEYQDGERFTILDVTLSQTYPLSEQYGVGHIIATTPLGNSFRLNVVDEL